MLKTKEWTLNDIPDYCINKNGNIDVDKLSKYIIKLKSIERQMYIEEDEILQGSECNCCKDKSYSKCDEIIEEDEYDDSNLSDNNSKIVLTKIDNGIIAKCKNGDFNNIIVYEEKDYSIDSEENFEHYVKLFYDIMEYFGDFNSKHRNKNINIQYE